MNSLRTANLECFFQFSRCPGSDLYRAEHNLHVDPHYYIHTYLIVHNIIYMYLGTYDSFKLVALEVYKSCNQILPCTAKHHLFEQNNIVGPHAISVFYSTGTEMLSLFYGGTRYTPRLAIPGRSLVKVSRTKPRNHAWTCYDEPYSPYQMILSRYN